MISGRNTCNSRHCTNAIPTCRASRSHATATADQATHNEILVRLGLGEARVFLSSFDRPNIRYTVVEKDSARKQLLGFLTGRKGQAGITGIGSAKIEHYGEELLALIRQADRSFPPRRASAARPGLMPFASGHSCRAPRTRLPAAPIHPGAGWPGD